MVVEEKVPRPGKMMRRVLKLPTTFYSKVMHGNDGGQERLSGEESSIYGEMLDMASILKKGVGGGPHVSMSPQAFKNGSLSKGVRDWPSQRIECKCLSDPHVKDHVELWGKHGMPQPGDAGAEY